MLYSVFLSIVGGILVYFELVVMVGYFEVYRLDKRSQLGSHFLFDLTTAPSMLL